MKTKIISFTCLILLMYSSLMSQEVLTNNPAPATPSGSVNVFCTPDLYILASTWASEYSSLYPDQKIQVSNVADADFATTLQKGGNIGFISNEYQATGKDESAWRIVVGRDVIVSVMNPGNPFLAQIIQEGISPGAFSRIFGTPGKQDWGTFLGNSKSVPMKIYMIKDESIRKGVTKFLGMNQLPEEWITAVNGEEMIAEIQKDPLAIGFCKLTSILDPGNQSIIKNIQLLPIDKNGNGRIDNMEKIYDDANTFMRGVWVGKYPKSLNSEIYSVSNEQPTNETETAFLKWVVTDGQQFLNSIGYSDLASAERQMQIEKISLTKITTTVSKNGYFFIGLALLALAALVVLGFIGNAFIWHFRGRKVTEQDDTSAVPIVFDENTVVVPKGLYYDKTHTWAFMEKDGAVKIGIDDFLQHVTGPITRIEMKNPGEKIKRGERVFSIIQSGKQLRIYSPVSGTIKEQNAELITNSSRLNTSPYSEGWVYMIEPSNWLSEIQLLTMAEKYMKWLFLEFTRVKDFLAVTLKTRTVEYTQVVLQDGGVLKDSILSDLGPEVWEDFQTNFLDTSK